MADKDGIKENKDYGIGIPMANQNFYVRGCSNYDWGMKNRLSRIFNPKSGKTLMLAFDHGYFLGPTSGLERLDLKIPPLVEDIDVLMATRGALRSCIPPELGWNKAVALRCSSGSSILDEDLSNEIVSVNIEDAIRMNASCMAIQVFIGAPHEKQSIENLSKTIDAGNHYGIPTMGVVAVGKNMERIPQYFRLATRMIAEFGAQIAKSYYCDEFETVTSCCPIPIVMAGGKKLPENEALDMCYKAITQGAAGVDMGRNIFQAADPSAMVKAVRAVVHEGLNGSRAFEMYNDLKKK
jgi:putative autoinducer-2 (AI-2) aldolase